MLLGTEVKGELARIHPVRACCRRAQLAGLLYGDSAAPNGNLRTLGHATARTAMHLASTLAVGSPGQPRPAAATGRGQRHLQVLLDPDLTAGWQWSEARHCDRRAFMRGVVLAAASISLRGPHVEFVFRNRARAAELVRRLGESDVRAGMVQRRRRWVVYVKDQEQVASLLRLTGANRGLLDFEAGRVGREVRNRLNRLLNAEEANLDRTVRAADRQLQAIATLEARGHLAELGAGLREAALQRRLQPEADLDTLAAALGVSRSAVNHRLRRLVELAHQDDALSAATTGDRCAHR